MDGKDIQGIINFKPVFDPLNGGYAYAARQDAAQKCACGSEIAGTGRNDAKAGDEPRCDSQEGRSSQAIPLDAHPRQGSDGSGNMRVEHGQPSESIGGQFMSRCKAVPTHPDHAYASGAER